MAGYLVTQNKKDCSGCGACKQICPRNAITMNQDDEGFLYPETNMDLCVNCDQCRQICPMEHGEKNQEEQYAWGGYYNSNEVRENSTSGGAFTALVETWFSKNSEAVIFGAEQISPTEIIHSYSLDLEGAKRFRKSKYLQSNTKDTYLEVKNFLKEGKCVLYSGTPCQISGLKKVLGTESGSERLLTVEVVCEGVPSPLYFSKYLAHLERRFRKKAVSLDWRDKNKRKWDFEFMKVTFDDGSAYKISRWFNPFWTIWLRHLMSRPSCYECPYTTRQRVADITIADLWGVHLYCPELYGKNGGSSLVVCNTEKGRNLWNIAKEKMYGHELDINDAIKYQGPMRKHIEFNPERNTFMKDLCSEQIDYKKLCRKWGSYPSPKLLWQKYVYGNRQKVALWNLKEKFKKSGR